MYLPSYFGNDLKGKHDLKEENDRLEQSILPFARMSFSCRKRVGLQEHNMMGAGDRLFRGRWYLVLFWRMERCVGVRVCVFSEFTLPPMTPWEGQNRDLITMTQGVELGDLRAVWGPSPPSLTHYYCLPDGPLNTLHPHPDYQSPLCYFDPSARGGIVPPVQAREQGLPQVSGRTCTLG